MAQLYRRVRRLSNRVLTRACRDGGKSLSVLGLWGGLALTGAGATSVYADELKRPAVAQLDTAPSQLELTRLGADLASTEVERRKAAHDTLLALGDDALPAIQARLTQLAARVDTAKALSAMSAFRRVQGATSPDAEVDLARGVLPVLERERSRATTDAAELVLFLRALEAQKSAAAAHVIVGQLFAVEPKLFRFEAPRTRERLGVLMLPALVRHRNHARPWIRDFCNKSLLDMHMETPGRAVQQDDVTLLAALLTAYGDTLTFDAMPVIVSYLTDERVAVREAAVGAIRRFGKNAIWQLRERYLNATGREADPGWGYQRILDELFAMHDEPRKKSFGRELAAAQTALEAGDIEAASAALGRALEVEPESVRAKAAAPLYARVAGSHLENGELERSLTAYRRALRLSPDAEESASFQARVQYLEAELRLERGIVDLEGYRRALALDPSLSRAAETLDLVSGEKAARERLTRRIVGFFAALLMLIAAFALLRSARLSTKGTPVTSDEPEAPRT